MVVFLSAFSVKMEIAGEMVAVEVPAVGGVKERKLDDGGVTGVGTTAASVAEMKFVGTEYQSRLLTEIVQSYAVGDLCLVGKYNFLYIFLFGAGACVFFFELFQL